MPKKPKRDDADHLQRLKLDFPEIHADLAAGRIPSLRKALILAGLKTERTRLDKLKNSWSKASMSERQAFLAWLATHGGSEAADLGAGAESPPSRRATPGIASGRYLHPETITEIRTIMNRRRMRPNAIMAEMGFAADDMALTRALAKGASLRLSVIAALEIWLRDNRGN